MRRRKWMSSVGLPLSLFITSGVVQPFLKLHVSPSRCSRRSLTSSVKASGLGPRSVRKGQARNAAAEGASGGKTSAKPSVYAEEIVDALSKAGADHVGVFYNKVGAINRDLSVLMATVLSEERQKEWRSQRRTGKKQLAAKGQLVEDGDTESSAGLVVLDAFAASGVRALRYLTEVHGVSRVVANDHDLAAIGLMRRAADMCHVEDKLELHHGDAMDVMYGARAGGSGTYDFIDIDPFGESAPFLDASVQAVKNGGMLCITSTDMPVLTGVQPAAAFARYGSVPTRSGYHPEMSLRILLHATSAAAGRHRRSIHPVLSVAIDHYVRVFVRVFRSPKSALSAARDHTSYVLQSRSCPSFFLAPVVPPHSARRYDVAAAATSQSPNSVTAIDKERAPEAAANALSSLIGICPETGDALKCGGPIWSGPLHDDAWVARAIALASGATPHTVDTRRKFEPQEDRVCRSTASVRTFAEEAHNTGPRANNANVRRPRLTAGPRVTSLLRAISRELPDVPLFYNLRDMFATVGLARSPQREQVMRALEAAGYRVSGMHKEPLALKTDAPDAAVWDVLRCWVRDNPQPAPMRPSGRAIIQRGPQIISDIDFSPTSFDSNDQRETSKRRGDYWHTSNPERRWGPLPKVGAKAVASARPHAQE